MASLAEMRALAAARRQPPALELVAPNDDKDELLRSFRADKAGAPALVEPVGAPAAAAPAAAALLHPRAQPVRPPRAGTCSACGRPVLRIGTLESIADPEPLRVLPQAAVNERRLREPGWQGVVGTRTVFGWDAQGRGVVGRVLPDEGTVDVYLCHLVTCPPNLRNNEGRRTSAWPDGPSERELAKDAKDQRWVERYRSGDDR
jgi:hypothetical protein